ncbi:MAG: hypothetical protein Q9207_003547 [Kuettlingeria erythrocarpa]
MDHPDQPSYVGRRSPHSDRTITQTARSRSSSSSSSSSSDTIRHSNGINKTSDEARSRQWIRDNDVTTQASDNLDTTNDEVFPTHGKRSFYAPVRDPSKDYTNTFRTLAEYEEWHAPIAEKVDAGNKSNVDASWAVNGFWRCVSVLSNHLGQEA